MSRREEPPQRDAASIDVYVDIAEGILLYVMKKDNEYLQQSNKNAKGDEVSQSNCLSRIVDCDRR